MRKQLVFLLYVFATFVLTPIVGYAESCSPGKYLRDQECIQCQAGLYCINDSIYPCPSGTYSASGASACTNIDPGYYASGCTGKINDSYTRLEYIESSGTQWIDTGLYGTQDTSAEIDFSFLSNTTSTRSFGDLTTVGSGFLFTTNEGAINSFLQNAYGPTWTWNTDTKIIPGASRHKIRQDKQYFYVNDELYATLYQTESFTTGGTLTIFGANYDGFQTASMRAYSLKIWDNDVLIRDFVPARRNSDGIIGLYDIVEGQFYTNQGTGNFIAGPISSTACASQKSCPAGNYCTNGIMMSCPGGTYSSSGASTCNAAVSGNYASNCTGKMNEDYIILEYIESSGTQWIDTGIYGTQDTTAEADFQFLPDTITTRAFGDATNGGPGLMFSAQLGVLGSAYQNMYYWKWSAIENSVIATPDRHKIRQDKQYFYIDDKLISTIDPPESAFTTANTLKLFGAIYHDGLKTSSMRVYSLKIWNGDVLVRDFVPVRRISDDAVGMYDIVEGRFYANQGSGNFVAGPNRLTACTSQTSCPAGDYCVNGVKTTCLAGTYSQSGAAACAQPANGYYASDCNANNTACKAQSLCAAGNYCIGGVKEMCPDGTYSTSGASVCTPTDTGYYASDCTFGTADKYVRLEYIESSGTQWIDTGIYGTQDTSVEADFQFLSDTTTTRAFGDSTNVDAGIVFSTMTGTTESSYQNKYGDQWGPSRTPVTPIIPYTNRHKIRQEKNYLYIDDVLYAYITSTTPFTTSATLKLFGANYNGFKAASMRAYSLKIWSNGTLVRDFVPVRSVSDGVVGMYDIVGNKFYTNQGTGNFIAGAIGSAACKAQTICPIGNYCVNGSMMGQCDIGTWAATGAASCTQCTNAPDNTVYTKNGWTDANCPWECDAGYGLTSAGTCGALCPADFKYWRTGTGLKIPLFGTQNTIPSVAFGDPNGLACYADLIPGETSNAIHVRYNGVVYHTVN